MTGNASTFLLSIVKSALTGDVFWLGEGLHDMVPMKGMGSPCDIRPEAYILPDDAWIIRE